MVRLREKMEKKCNEFGIAHVGRNAVKINKRIKRSVKKHYI